MRPRFIASGEAPPARSLAIDGGLAGCDASYGHWVGVGAPEAIAADTGTAIMLRAARDPERWLAGFEHCCNDHVDADGLLAAVLACRPELAVRHGPLMVGAASYGDFCAWPGASAAQLALRLHQLLRGERADGGNWEQRCYDQAVDDFERLVAQAELSDDERDAQVQLILHKRQAVERKDDPEISLLGGKRLCTAFAPRVYGHHPDDPFTVFQTDDIPPWALSGYIPADFFQLLAIRGEAGTAWQLDAPRHSWAHTVHLPRVAWPDLSTVAKALQRDERQGVRWVAGDAARQRGFTCLLASVDVNGAAAESALAHERVAGAIEKALAGAAKGN